MCRDRYSRAAEPFISLRPGSTLRRLTEELCARAGFRPRIVFEGDDLSSVWGFVAAGLGVAVVPTPRASSPGGVTGPVRYLEIGDSGAERVIYLSWPAGRPLLPAAELFREHVVSQVQAGLVPAPLAPASSLGTTPPN